MRKGKTFPSGDNHFGGAAFFKLHIVTNELSLTMPLAPARPKLLRCFGWGSDGVCEVDRVEPVLLFVCCLICAAN